MSAIELVRPRRNELAVYQIRRWPGLLVTPGRHRPAVPVTVADQARLPHQPRNPLAAALLAPALQFGVDTGRTIRLARTGVHRAHLLQQRCAVKRLAAAIQDATGDSVRLAYVDQGYTG